MELVLLAIALLLHSLLFIALTGVCAFDEGQLADDWTDCLIPLAIVLLPLALATLGALRSIDGLVVAAAIIAGLFGFVSITGPGVFLLVPAILYGISIPAKAQPMQEDS